jgi:hypothetical protein
MKFNQTLYRNETYSTAQKAVERLIGLLGTLGISGIPHYWMDCQEFAHGYTHRMKGINAYVEETPDEQRRKITKSNTGTRLD